MLLDDLLDKALEANTRKQVLLVDAANKVVAEVEWKHEYYGASYIERYEKGKSVYYDYKRIALRTVTAVIFKRKARVRR